MIVSESGCEIVSLPKGARIIPGMSETEYDELCKQIKSQNWQMSFN